MPLTRQHPADAPEPGSIRSLEGVGPDEPALLARAREQLRLVDRRQRLFGDAGRLFADPAWHMLLDLFVNGATDARMPVSSGAIAARVPTSTAMRYIALLERRSLVVRRANPDDRRSALLSLTPTGADLIRRVLAHGS